MSQTEQLQQNLQQQSENLDRGDIFEGVRLDTEFHILPCEFLGNVEILRVMRQLTDKMYRVILRVFQKSSHRMATSMAEHRALVESLVEGNGDRASQIIADHLERGRRMILEPRK